ncbi:MAG: SufD family Fe-S cluster assembly protein [Bifidobacteriaceae bacterium]|jgi:Fe-S cluster assembly protein SufD|nr:SufD family Fe-S cluster assembly protein [Bifidobacteriaceae bacterium]
MCVRTTIESTPKSDRDYYILISDKKTAFADIILDSNNDDIKYEIYDTNNFKILINLNTPNVNVNVYALYLASNSSAKLHTIVNHNAPDCTSFVHAKGALTGSKARTSWIGDVHISPNASGTSTNEKNENLVLTPGAKAVSVPNLEILTGEILGARHSSSITNFDDEQLFYLTSRGISETAAKSMIVGGFFDSIISKFPAGTAIENVRKTIENEFIK